jgi:hypothetical protein
VFTLVVVGLDLSLFHILSYVSIFLLHWKGGLLVVLILVHVCCYADVSNALTKLLKCCFSRSATLPSTFYR